MDKLKFKKELENRNFSICIDMIRSELISIIKDAILKKDKYFSYSTSKDLYEKSVQVLDNKKYINAANIIYHADIMEDSDEIILYDLIETYKDLIS